MGQQSADTRLLRDQERSADRILEKPAAYPSSLVGDGYGQPGEYYDWYGVAPHPFPDPLRRFEEIDLAYRQAEESRDPGRLSAYESLGRAGGLGL